MEKPIIHQEFYNCYLHCPDDDFFKKYFLSCARGEFSKCFYYNQNKKEIRASKNINSKEIVNFKFTDNVELNFKTIRHIFSDILHLGTNDENDKAREIKSLDQKNKLVQEMSANEWKNVKNMDVKRMKMNIFMKELIQTYPKLDEMETLSCLMDALTKTEIKSADIVIENGVIKSIKCMSLNDDQSKIIITKSKKR